LLGLGLCLMRPVGSEGGRHVGGPNDLPPERPQRRGTSFTFATASGKPMIVIASSSADARWSNANEQPAKTSQMTLRTTDAPPASGRLTTVRPSPLFAPV
jgi:hypothetical protein